MFCITIRYVRMFLVKSTDYIAENVNFRQKPCRVLCPMFAPETVLQWRPGEVAERKVQLP